jgi:hypothetical protein
MQDEIQQAVAKELGIEGLTSEEQQDLIAQMTGILLKAASIAILEKLPESKRDEFVAIAGQENETAIRTFLEKELPESEAIVRTAVAEEIRRFKDSQTTVTTA